MSPFRIRPRAVLLLLGSIALLIAGILVWMTSVPGTSHSGPVGTPGDALRAELVRDVTALAETIGERNVVHSQALDVARRYVETQLVAAGLSPTREDHVVDGVTCSNVVATVSGASRASEIVVVGAHYDSVLGSPGANDNATGVAAMLALARRFARGSSERTLRFVAFVNEEPPFFQTEDMGSRVHARAARSRGEDVVAMLSLETLGCYSDEPGSQQYPSPLLRLFYPYRGDFVTFVGNLGSRGLLRDVVREFRAHARIPSEGGALPAWVTGVDWSDHASFWREGYPALMVTDTAVFRDPHYHERSDRVEHVDFVRLALVVEGLEAVVARLANPDRGR